MLRVGMKFCGGCNPSIDRTAVYREIRELAGEIAFLSLQERDLDVFLLICGCQTSCPVEELGLHGRPKTIVVAGETVDGRPVPEHLIPRAVVEKLRELEAAPSLQPDDR